MNAISNSRVNQSFFSFLLLPLFWISLSLVITNLHDILFWLIKGLVLWGYSPWEALVSAIDSWGWRWFNHNPLIPYAILPVLLLGIAVTLFETFAKFTWRFVLIPLVLLAFVFAFLFFTPCEGLACIAQGFALYLHKLMIFIAMAILPIVWAKLRTEQSGFKNLVTKNFFPGVLIVSFFSLFHTVLLYVFFGAR